MDGSFGASVELIEAVGVLATVVILVDVTVWTSPPSEGVEDTVTCWLLGVGVSVDVTVVEEVTVNSLGHISLPTPDLHLGSATKTNITYSR